VPASDDFLVQSQRGFVSQQGLQIQRGFYFQVSILILILIIDDEDDYC
jgi:hypothetical protein